MASIYDEINKIKREGSDYDTSLDSQGNPTAKIKDAPLDIQMALSPWRVKGANNLVSWSQPFIGDKVDPDFGNSKYDKGLTADDLLYSDRSLEDIRAERQPWYDQLGNNLLNMGVIAGTTFADSFVGLGAGIVNMAFGDIDEDSKLSRLEQAGNRFVNSPESIWLNSINKWVKTNYPTYTTDEYRRNQDNGEWWKNIGTRQFWGENIIENAGFTLGMVASGKVSGTLLNRISRIAEQSNVIKRGVDTAIKEGKIAGATLADSDKIVKEVLTGKRSLQGLDLTGEMSNAVKDINQISTINSNIATAIATTGEARQEGINASQEYEQRNLMNFESLAAQQELLNKTILEVFSRPDTEFMFNSDPTTSDNPISTIKPEYLETINKEFQKNKENAIQAIKDTSARTQTMVFALNFPVLYASSLWQFGRTFKRGYDTQKGFLNNIKGALRKDTGLELNNSDRIIKEGEKYIVKNTTGDKIKRGLKIASNPLAEFNEEMLQSAVQEGSERYYGSKMNSFLGYKLDPDSEQNQISAIQSIWNGIIDTYSDPSNYDQGFAGLFMGGLGSLNFTFSRNSQGKIPVFEGGILQDIRDVKQESQELQSAADALNDRLSDPNFINYYQGLIRHNALENNKEDALNNNDKFTYLNNDHAQLISDIITFEKAGKIQDLYDIIDSNTKKFSTTNKDEVTKIADDLRELAKNQSTNQDLYANKTDEEIVGESLKFNQELKESIDTYRNISSNLNSLIGDSFKNEDEFNEMVYMFSQIDNFEKRYNSLRDDLVEKLNNINNYELNNKLFKINLDNSEKNLTLAQIIDQASPSQFLEFLVGKSKDEDFDYLKGLLTSNKDLADVHNSLASSINSIMQNRNKRGTLTQQQEKEIGSKKEVIKDIDNLLSNTKERVSIIEDINDLLKIEDARAKLTNLYNKYTGNTVLLTDFLSGEVKKAADEQENIKNQTVKDKLKQSTSIQEVRDIVNKEKNEKNNNYVDNIISKMSLSDNADFSPLVADYKQIEDLNKQVSNSPVLKNEPTDIANGVNQLFDILKRKYNSVGELQDPIITQEDIGELGNRNINYNQEDRERIVSTLKNILSDINRNRDRFNNVNTNNKVVPKEADKVNKEISDTNVPIGNINSKELNQENLDIKSNLDDKNTIDEVQNKVWNNGTFEINIDVYNNTGKIISQDNEVYRPANEFLNKNGAFDYVNSGKLTRGQKVYFIADENYWKELINNGANPDWVNNNQPLLLVVEDNNGTITSNNKKYQIVGTFNKNLNNNLYNKVISNKNVVDESISTSIANITPGRLEFNEDKLLNSLEGTTPWNENIQILFGIADSTGQLNTNLDSSKYSIFNVTPVNEYSNSGRLYLLTKSAVTNTYIPTAVRVKNLSEVDFTEDNTLFNELRKFIDNIATAALSRDENKLADEVHNLRNILYVGSKAGISISLRSDPQGSRTDYNIVLSKNNQSEIINVGYSELREVGDQFSDNGFDEVSTFNTREQITSNILNGLSKLKAPFQINKDNINGKWNVRQSLNYNRVLLDANILTTNLSNSYVKGAYFVMNPIDNDLREIPNINTPRENNNTIINSEGDNIIGNKVTIKEKSYFLNDRGEVYNADGDIITSNNIINAVKVTDYINKLPNDEVAKIKFTGEELFDDSIFYRGKVYYLLPNNKIYNITDYRTEPSGKLIDTAIQRVIKERDNTLNTSNQEINNIEDEDTIVNEVSPFNNIKISNKRESKTPKTPRVNRSADDIVSLGLNNTSINEEEIKDKINKNKDYQKDNCNGIKPI